MKKLLIKIPAMIAMLITLYSFFSVVQSFVEDNGDIWILAVILAVLSLFFYTADAIISIVKAAKNIDCVFNVILAVVLIVAIPMAIWIGGSPMIHNLFIWNGYYLAMFILEIVSMIRIVKLSKTDRKTIDA